MKPKLQDIMGGYPPSPVHKWWRRYSSDDIHIYVLPDDNRNGGFEFYVLEWAGCNAGEELWQNPSVNVLIRGTARFDGIRHMHFDDEGYLYYPDTCRLGMIMKILRSLEEELCDKDQIE